MEVILKKTKKVGGRMKDRDRLHNLLLITAMVGLFIFAGLFDFLINSLTERNYQLGTLDLALVWLFPSLQFLFALAACGLVWLMASIDNYSRWVSVLFLAVGLILLIANPIIYMGVFPEITFILVLLLSPGSLLFEASGLIVALGFLSLLLRKTHKPRQFVPINDVDDSPDSVLENHNSASIA